MISNCRPTSGAQLKQMQSWPLKAKVWFSKQRIKEFYEHCNGQVYISFSGGKDSTALLHLVRSLYPEVPAVFINTGLEYPQVVQFVREQENITWLMPTLSFKEVLGKYGYPVVSKEVSQKVYELRTTKSEVLRRIRLQGDEKGNGKLSSKWHFLAEAPFPISGKCCDIMKKNPAKRYEKSERRFPITGMMAQDSSLRAVNYIRNGCNSFDSKRFTSTPIAFWTTEDVWSYIRENKLSYSSFYDTNKSRSTGCMFCPLGVQNEHGKNRFQYLKEQYPKLHRYCMNELGMKEVLEYLQIDYE